MDTIRGTLVSSWFDIQETLNGYFHVLHQILDQYGIPYQFITDNKFKSDYFEDGIFYSIKLQDITFNII